MNAPTAPGAEAPTTTERPPLTPYQAEPVTDALAKAYAVAMLLSVADGGVGATHAGDAAMIVLDYLETARAELVKLTEAAA